MIEVVQFAYTDAQWDAIKVVVRRRLGDADRIERLRPRIESAARMHILGSLLESQRPGHKTRIKKLRAMLVKAKALRADLIDVFAPSGVIGDTEYRPMPRDVEPLANTEDAIATIVSVIEAGIAAQRPQRIANTSKAVRNRLWSEALSIWLDIGGKATGIAAAEFVVAMSNPVFRKVREAGGHKTASGMPQFYNSVVEWLRLRAKAQQRSTVRRKAS